MVGELYRLVKGNFKVLPVGTRRFKSSYLSANSDLEAFPFGKRRF